MDRRIQLVKKRIFYYILLTILFSCQNRRCGSMKVSYGQEWKDEIDTIVYSQNKRFIYLIKTRSEQVFRIKGTQWVVKNFLNGDSIYKKKNSPFAYVYRNGEFVFVTKIAPSYCDLENVNKEFDFQEEYYVSSDKIDSVYIPERFFIKP
jgi:hypothetical protein